MVGTQRTFVECVNECTCREAGHRKELKACLQGGGILVEEIDTERDIILGPVADDPKISGRCVQSSGDQGNG